ncbi:MAG: RnfABCDGE type electron transport complex subunit D [Nitrosomonadales bacterium]|nr:RnfABCDGE type electron transport complex subunit D [Nitrosomonadales bacterium]
MWSSPFITTPSSVSQIMLRVLIALIPGIALYVWYFGPAILVSIALASITALATEAVMLKLRQRPLKPFLTDNSALITGWLLALSIPALAPWWLVVVGTAFGIAVAKHLYGGLGNNPFNPAMVGYAVLIVSFPAHMTHWLTPHPLGDIVLTFSEQMNYMFNGVLPAGLTLDALTMATPLDTLKTQLHLGLAANDIRDMPIYGRLAGKGSEMVSIGFAIGGLYLIYTRVINWLIPAVFLGALFVISGTFHLLDPVHYVTPMFHWFAGAAMLGAFFIYTDPVGGATTFKGRIIYASGAALITYLIRAFGGFPDGIAFAALLMNICVPLIDIWTQPRVFGKKGGGK